jgi:hypothetical protein
MKRLLYLVVFWGLALLPIGLRADSDQLPDTLSSKAELSLLTCAPGTELYSIFGHSSIRVHDPVQRFDWVFNYGTFDFATPGFGMKFVQGKLPYYLLSYSMRNFMAEYEDDLRAVREQVLRLTDAQKEAMLQALKRNELPENKFYLYDFFYDNCSSRERDLLRSTLGDKLRLKQPAGKEYGSYRSLIHPYLHDMPWTDFGIQLVLGLPTDKTAGLEGAVFLPDHLFDVLAASEVLEDGGWKPLVQESRPLYSPPPVAKPALGFFGPWIVMWLVLAVAATISFLPFGNARGFRLFDTLLFGATGLLGILMLLFWLATDHEATYANLNMIWALPTHLFFAVAVWVRRWGHLVTKYAFGAAALLILFLLANWFLPQSFHPAVYPLVAAMALRLVIYRVRSQD